MRTALVAMVLLGSVGVARAGSPGTMVLTAEQVDTSDANFEKTAKSKQISTLSKSGEQWTLYFLAFLKKAEKRPVEFLRGFQIAAKGLL